MKVFYWSPHISHVATVTAVLNSAESLIKYSNKKYYVSIINAIGEWTFCKEDIQKKKINLINLNKKEIFNDLPRYGFIRSRLSYWIIFFYSIFPLKKILSLEKPDFFIIHLITSLPLVLLNLFNFKTKFILRVSGYPKLTILRKFLWKLSSKKIYKVFCPTKATLNYLLKNKIFSKEQLMLLYDPIIKISEINFKKKELINNINFRKKEFILTIGRLTRQKNTVFLVKCFKKILEKNPKFKLIILGEGEDKEKLIDIIKKNEMENSVLLLGFKKNVYKYINQSKCFVLTSLWEDPGFVLMEAAATNTPIISSNCPNGPYEFLENGNAGFLFENNNKEDFLSKFDEFMIQDEKSIKKKIIKAKKNSRKYTAFRHQKTLETVLIR